MSEGSSPFDQSEPSADDLAVLQAFDAMEEWNAGQGASSLAAPEQSTPEHDTYGDSLDDMLQLFVSEADEDIAIMRRALQQLEQDEHINPAHFMTLQRAAHKVCGTAGAMGYDAMATIAHHIEVISEQIMNGMIFPVIGVNALAQAVLALETTLTGVITTGEESEVPLAELTAAFDKLAIDLQEPRVSTANSDGLDQITPSPSGTLVHISSKPLHDVSPPFIRVDARRVEQLTLHSDQLIEQRTALQNAQAEVETALQKLHAAQTRLQQIEVMLSSLHSPIKSALDELELERYTERDVLMRSLNEAIADVAMTSSQLRIAYTRLHAVMQTYIAQASAVRSDTLLLRLAPLSTLVPRLQRAITMSALAQEQPVQFEVRGEATEIDQDILEFLTPPLLQLLRTCITDTSTTARSTEIAPHRVWLYAQGMGNDIRIEVGFSMTVKGGAVDAIRASIQHLNGTLSLERNATGGASFHLRLPRSQGVVRCLLVHAGSQHVIVPFSQVQRIGNGKQEEFDMLYQLTSLLGIPAGSLESPLEVRVQPVLVLPQRESSMLVGIEVDEVVGEVELVVKPLTTYMQRPGIAGAAVDGRGSVLLMLDLPELVRHYTIHRQSLSTATPGVSSPQSSEQTQPVVLIADDSVYLRQSLQFMLKHANYSVREARDGMEALEQLIEYPPDVFLLDMEMPNLNGYDLLGIMHLYPGLTHVKIVMLTSHTSDKHRQRALELGAHAYLTKPCSQEMLLETIQALLK